MVLLNLYPVDRKIQDRDSIASSDRQCLFLNFCCIYTVCVYYTTLAFVTLGQVGFQPVRLLWALMVNVSTRSAVDRWRCCWGIIWCGRFVWKWTHLKGLSRKRRNLCAAYVERGITKMACGDFFRLTWRFVWASPFFFVRYPPKSSDLVAYTQPTLLPTFYCRRPKQSAICPAQSFQASEWAWSRAPTSRL